jgi:hypothetical protein
VRVVVAVVDVVVPTGWWWSAAMVANTWTQWTGGVWSDEPAVGQHAVLLNDTSTLALGSGHLH